VSMRARVASAEVSGPATAVARAELAAGDLTAAGNVENLSFTPTDDPASPDALITVVTLASD